MRKNLHNKILKEEYKEQHLSIVPKSCLLKKGCKPVWEYGIIIYFCIISFIIIMKHFCFLKSYSSTLLFHFLCLDHGLTNYRLEQSRIVDCSFIILFITSFFGSHVWAIPILREKIGLCPFHTKNPAFCPLFQTNQGNVSILKFYFLKIEFQMYNSIFGTSSYNECGFRNFFFFF